MMITININFEEIINWVSCYISAIGLFILPVITCFYVWKMDGESHPIIGRVLTALTVFEIINLAVTLHRFNLGG